MRALAAALILCVFAQSVTAQESRRPPSVNASGTVDVAIPPDRATIILTVSGEGLDLGAAAAAVDTAAARVVTVARRHDLTIVPWGGSYGENVAVRRMMPGQSDVRTTRDYLARRGVLLVVPEIARLNQVLLDLAETGIAGFIQLVYYVDESNGQLRSAHAQAAAIAQERASTMAEELGGELGPLLSLSTPQGFMPQLLQRLQIHDGMNNPLQASDVLLRVMVNGTWEFRGR